MKKKLYAVVLSVAMLLSIGSVGAFAKNYHDTSFDFTFVPRSSASVYTSARVKEDPSSAYMKLKTLSSGSYYARVVKADHSNFSKTWTYLFDSSDRNQGRYLKSYAYEDDGYHVSVRIRGTRGPISPNIGIHATGVWSPDSL